MQKKITFSISKAHDESFDEDELSSLAVQLSSELGRIILITSEVSDDSEELNFTIGENYGIR